MLMNTSEYLSIIENIKNEIKAAQYRAAVHANTDMLLLYYDIGCFCVYEKWVWRFIPWNRPPVLKEQYDGIIYYKLNGIAGEKSISVWIKQTWLGIDVKTKTDINSSVTITATILSEFGQDVLYYTYMTNPSAATQKSNPIQHGTCRMVLNGDNKTISGKYWTSSNTTGDIEWKAVKTRK